MWGEGSRPSYITIHYIDDRSDRGDYLRRLVVFVLLHAVVQLFHQRMSEGKNSDKF